MLNTSKLDTDLLDFLESRDDWYGIMKLGNDTTLDDCVRLGYVRGYHIEYQAGRLGPFPSLRGALLSFQEAVTNDES